MPRSPSNISLRRHARAQPDPEIVDTAVGRHQRRTAVVLGELDPVLVELLGEAAGRPGQQVIGHADHATARIRGRSTTSETDRRRSSRQAPVSHDDGVVDDIAALLADEGVLLESARGPIPNVAELVAGAPIRGSWWAHPQSHRIFATINALADSPDVARMRLVNGRITLVHRRLWPALLRLETRLPPGMLVVVLEEHTPTGAHRVTNVPLASWVAADVREAAAGLDEQAALTILPAVIRDHLV